MAGISRLSNSDFLDTRGCNDGDEPAVLGELKRHDLNVLCQRNSSGGAGVVPVPPQGHQQAVALGSPLAAAPFCLCTFCSCPSYETAKGSAGLSPPLSVCQQPLDGGISPVFFFSLFLSTSPDLNLIRTISYRILIYAKFTVSFSNSQSREKFLKLKLHSLSNSYFKRKIYTSWQSFDASFLFNASSPV